VRIKIGMILFIISELIFFLSFFWAFFHRSLSPSIEIGMQWPPLGIEVINPMRVPLLNTIILLSSAVTLTWAHHSLIERKDPFRGIVITILLALYFTALQAREYFFRTFTMADSVYGSLFFISTGFHGLHVIVGTLFLTVSRIRSKRGHFSRGHHMGFEAAVWY